MVQQIHATYFSVQNKTNHNKHLSRISRLRLTIFRLFFIAFNLQVAISLNLQGMEPVNVHVHGHEEAAALSGRHDLSKQR